MATIREVLAAFVACWSGLLRDGEIASSFGTVDAAVLPSPPVATESEGVSNGD